MQPTKLETLRLLYEAGGVSNEYPFIEGGLVHVLSELLAEGLVALHPPRHDSFKTIKITAKGQEIALSVGAAPAPQDH